MDDEIEQWSDYLHAIGQMNLINFLSSSIDYQTYMNQW